MPMQLIGDPNFASRVPSDCSSSGTAENTVDTFGSNGVIGVGLFQQDCGAYCTTGAQSGNYYTCSSSFCTATTVSLAQQVPNPISLFGGDNNGVIISLPSVPSGMGVSVNGTMTFGIGTRKDNSLGSASIFPMNSQGNFTTVYGGNTMPNSFVDSGSNGLFFNDASIATCSDGWYCPPYQLNLTAYMVGQNSVYKTIGFSIANVDTALASLPNDSIYVPLGAPSGDDTSFDWGLPFFFGRNVFVITENQTVSGITGPFVAF
jgi:hypothetical protein